MLKVIRESTDLLLCSLKLVKETLAVSEPIRCKNETKRILVICVFLRLKRSLFPVIGPETSRYFLNQSDAKVKQTASWSSTFFCA